MPPSLSGKGRVDVPRFEPRNEIERLKPYRPGRSGPANVPDVLLGSNENPFGPSHRVVDAIVAHARGVNRYPEPHPEGLQQAIADRYGLSADQIVFGTGADQLIRLLALVYVAPGTSVVVPTPSFPSYAMAVEVMGGVVRTAGLTADGAMDLDALADAVDAQTRLMFLCSPNNPTGGIPDCAALPDFLAAMADRGILTVVDEAYGEYADGDGAYHTMLTAALGTGVPVVVLRTFSKAYGLAGLRIGWAACPPEVADVLRRTREIFAVSGIAEAAALAAWHDTAWRDDVVRRTQATRERFLARVDAERLRAYPSWTNFVAVASHPDTAQVAAGFAAHGVQVRPTEGFGLPGHIRVTMGRDDEMERFWEAFSAVDATLPFPRR